MNLQVASALALASQAVYNTEDVCEEWATVEGYDEFHWIEAFDTQAMVVANDHACVIAFRGTEPKDIGDWMTDMDIRMVGGPFGMVHKGFQEAYEIVEDEIREVINEMPGENHYITGHSLGGALATVAAAHLPPMWSVYNFGSPRVGDEDYAKNVSDRRQFFRFTNNNDVVPRVPLSLRFAHAGDNYHFTTFGGMLKNPKNWRLTYDRFIGRLRWGIVDGIRDHSMGTYAQLVYKHMLG